MLYTVLKHLHVSAVVVSGLLFFWRGARVLLGYGNTGFALRVLPHIVDTLLLGSAIWLTLLLHQYPLTHAWLTAKLVALLLYIVFGHMALKKSRATLEQLFYFLLALALFVYILGAAHYHSPRSWLLRYG
jgi:uncharacterized membrane protein SirB2